jgi:hypothetical protein
VWIPCETWKHGYGATPSSLPRLQEHFMKATAMHASWRRIWKPYAVSSLECGKAGLLRIARGSELHPWHYERSFVGFRCDCQQFTGAGFSPLPVETSTLRGTRGMLRLRWPRSRTMSENPSAKMTPRTHKVACVDRHLAAAFQPRRGAGIASRSGVAALTARTLDIYPRRVAQNRPEP